MPSLFQLFIILLPLNVWSSTGADHGSSSVRPLPQSPLNTVTGLDVASNDVLPKVKKSHLMCHHI